MTHRIIISSVTELRDSVSDIIDLLRTEEEISDEKEYAIRICLRELLGNSLTYSGSEAIRLKFRIRSDEFDFTVRDGGRGFNHDEKEGCPDVFCERGRGIYIVRELADDVKYNKKGTCVTVRISYK